MKKRKNLLGIYFLVVAIILVLIMFVLPDDVFLWKYKNVELPNVVSPNEDSLDEETEENPFLDYEKQKEHLLSQKYSFKYGILDSMSDKTYSYTCQGEKDGLLVSGTCTGYESFSFDSDNMSEQFKIDTTYLNVKNILDLIGGMEGTLSVDGTNREYLYTVKIDELETEVIVYTDLETITKIEISNGYMVYVLEYTSM